MKSNVSFDSSGPNGTVLRDFQRVHFEKHREVCRRYAHGSGAHEPPFLQSHTNRPARHHESPGAHGRVFPRRHEPTGLRYKSVVIVSIDKGKESVVFAYHENLSQVSLQLKICCAAIREPSNTRCSRPTPELRAFSICTTAPMTRHSVLCVGK